MEILTLTNQLPTLLLNKSDDDISDRLNYRYTVALLITFSVIILTRQFSAGVSVELDVFFSLRGYQVNF
jgi:hypothetical protein